MHGTKDIAKQSRILWPRLEIREAALHAVQPFLALNQELPCQLIHCVHSSSLPES
jgi:hypothetical protein